MQIYKHFHSLMVIFHFLEGQFTVQKALVQGKAQNLLSVNVVTKIQNDWVKLLLTQSAVMFIFTAAGLGQSVEQLSDKREVVCVRFPGPDQ